jgi:hypothetical protein
MRTVIGGYLREQDEGFSLEAIVAEHELFSATTTALISGLVNNQSVAQTPVPLGRTPSFSSPRYPLSYSSPRGPPKKA